MNQVLRVKQVAECLGISVNSVWKKCNAKSHLYDPDFPQPFKVSANATGWLASEIHQFIQLKADQRKAAKP
ncbi:AlpA family phage regulatory protein [Kingella kingae]|uniref:Prophage CP4-57 regulatory protein (AlpA) n=1 Tax=Kingella negevensis TaxID=1522312 RepID=A0A238HIH9_9NEIS|nr:MULTISPECIES: AlpA family phage regulatory protein [Kingella]MDK4526796.1 AlpA family phage regulatory protein [Kingella kingae]MDK4528588.1 AlpA family phage regulatory protein [Kingella kingae]MDK4532816.1 AlpA family phage regulatory protein [Kingella kingae]MDK4535646.1 AlpA family phage regulatory protein [Kingella kingae]MDK4538135.1 AlpA family phage regulatory protein [Kingella kingae]